MKTIKMILVMSLISVLSASCQVNDSCIGACEEDGSSGSSGIDLNRLSVYTADDEFIGYALDFQFDFIKIYIPAYDQYVTMHPITGEYLEFPASSYEEIYFADLDCSGAAVMLNWSGKVGNTYIRGKNDRTYVIHSSTYYSINNRFNALSRLVANRPASDSCRNSNYTVETYAANLVETDSLVDLSPYAPFQLFTSSSEDSDDDDDDDDRGRRRR